MLWYSNKIKKEKNFFLIYESVIDSEIDFKFFSKKLFISLKKTNKYGYLMFFFCFYLNYMHNYTQYKKIGGK